MPLLALRRKVCSPVVAVVCLAIALGTGALSGCGPGVHAEASPKAKAVETPVIKAAVLAIEPTIWPTVVRAQGSLIADEVAIVGAKVAGRVNEVTFDLGDVVKANSVLATLDQEDFKLQVTLAEAQLWQSRAALGLKPTDPLESLDPEMLRRCARRRRCGTKRGRGWLACGSCS